MSTLSKTERQELSLLLPWYANGTLDADDSRKVEAALAQDDELAREFDLVLEDQAAVIDVVSQEEVPISMPERFKAALNAEVSKPDITEPAQPARESMITRLLSALFPEGPRAYAYAAVLVVIVMPAVATLSYMAGSQQSTQYQTATGGTETTSDGPRVLVQFKTGLVWSDIDAFLKANGGQVVKGPTADGFYELEFKNGDNNVENLGIETGVFEFVLPVN